MAYEPNNEKNSIINAHGTILHKLYMGYIDILRYPETRKKASTRELCNVLEHIQLVFIISNESRAYINILQNAIRDHDITMGEINTLQDDLDFIAELIRAEFSAKMDNDNLVLLNSSVGVGPAEEKVNHVFSEW